MPTKSGLSNKTGSDVTFTRETSAGPKARGKKRAEPQKSKSRRVTCQVNDCINELPNKAYHSRYKICAEHASAPHLLLNGCHMRFCQHHGRFHPIAEFDGSYRSCRSSLERHRNTQARRLKNLNNVAPCHGQVASASDGEGEMRGGGGGDGSGGLGGSSQQMRACGGGSTSGGASSGHTLTSGGGRCRRTPPAQGAEMLQSSLQAVLTDTGADGQQLLRMHSQEAPTPPHPAAPEALEIDDLLKMEALLDGDNGHDVGIWGLNGLAGPSGATAAGPGAGAAPGLHLPAVPALPSAPAVQLSVPTLDAILASASRVPPPPGPLAQLPPSASARSPADATAAAAAAAVAAASAIVPNIRCTLDAARSMLSIDLSGGAGPSAAVPAFHPPGPSTDGSLVSRTALKIFNAHPDTLPASLREALETMVANSATYLTANSRPGCAQITFEAILSAEELESLRGRGAAGLLDAALAAGAMLLPPELVAAPQIRMVAQVGTQVAVVGDAGAEACFQLGDGGTGDLRAVIPLAVTPAVAGQSQPFTALGAGISRSEDLLVCRRGHNVPDLGVLATGLVAEAGGVDASTYPPSSYTARGLEAGEYVQFSLMSLKPGLHCVEVQRGSLLSPSVPFLVLDDAAAAAELRQLEVDASGVEDVAAFVTAVGVVLDHLRLRQEAPDSPNASPAAAARVAPLAARAVAVAAARRWPALLRLLAPATSPTQVDAGLAPSGLTLLHLIAGSGCAAVAEALVDVWGDWVWACAPAGPRAIAPLHIAVSLDDGGAMASALTRLVGPEPWFTARSADGVTPAELAVAIGNAAVISLLGCLGPWAPKAVKAKAAAVWMDCRKCADENEVEAWRELSRAVDQARRGWGGQAACVALVCAARGLSKSQCRSISHITVAMIMAACAMVTMALRVVIGAP